MALALFGDTVAACGASQHCFLLVPGCRCLAASSQHSSASSKPLLLPLRLRACGCEGGTQGPTCAQCDALPAAGASKLLLTGFATDLCVLVIRVIPLVF